VQYGAIVIGGGHNGLICAAYLAKAGIPTVVLEARDSVGGCASTVDALDARVNICNCDHVVFRTTPVIDELGLADHGLRYLDPDPSQVQTSWSGEAAWPVFHDIERTLDALQLIHPDEVEGYRHYLDAAIPVAELVLEMANEPPTPGGVLSKLAHRRGRGAATLLRWSRSTAADVLRSFFTREVIMGPAVTTGPGVWGQSPFGPRTGLGALTYAMKHVGHVGRPVGGSGAVPASVRSAFEAAGGEVRAGARVVAILSEETRVRGVELEDGTVVEAPLVVSACDPRETFVRWLRDPPAAAGALVERWRAKPVEEGYESKIDAVITELPRFRSVNPRHFEQLGVLEPTVGTTIVSPTLDDIAAAHRLIDQGWVAQKPMFFVNIPSVLDPTMRVDGNKHVLSVETLYTPYSVVGGWEGSEEPQRWLRALGSLLGDGFLDTVERWRVMTPCSYEREFNLPRGHATSFGGSPLSAMLGREPELTRYETPIKGLYLTGAATYPGAGVWGAAGRNTATVILRSQ
jgi:phytoene dehydrogenase-like protein